MYILQGRLFYSGEKKQQYLCNINIQVQLFDQ